MNWKAAKKRTYAGDNGLLTYTWKCNGCGTRNEVMRRPAKVVDLKCAHCHNVWKVELDTKNKKPVLE